MADKQYEKRDAAFEAHIKSGPDRTAWAKDVARAAFNAGWEARKRTEYEAMIEQASLTPLRHLMLLGDSAIAALKGR